MKSSKLAICGALFAASFFLPTVARAQSAAAPPAQAVAAAPAPVAAKTLVDTALGQAKAEKKAVLVVFHASWCGWCHRLDKVLLEDTTMEKVLAKQYEIVHVDVQENGPKKAIENAGGDALQADWGGKQSGLPFYVFLDSDGKKLADSNVMGDKKTNIGYPGAPDEIAAFMDLLRKTAPRLSDDDSNSIVEALKKNAP